MMGVKKSWNIPKFEKHDFKKISILELSVIPSFQSSQKFKPSVTKLCVHFIDIPFAKSDKIFYNTFTLHLLKAESVTFIN